MPEREALQLMILAMLALLILQASGMAKNSALVMRYQITQSEQNLSACRMKAP